MIVTLIKVSEEVHDFDKHYWVGMEASITPEEDAVEQTKVLRKKLEQVHTTDIQISVIKNYAPPEELPSIDINDR